MTSSLPDVIFVEDDDALRTGASQALELEGVSVAAFADARAALEAIDPDFPGVVVSDVRLPGMDGIEFFERLTNLDDGMQVIFTTAHGDVDMAVNAMKNGAADFFPKPYSVSRLAHSIRRALEQRALTIENRKLRARLGEQSTGQMIGRSPASLRLERIVREVARTDADLLLQGDAGTGKSHLARQIHDLGTRADRPFVVIDAGIFANEEADLLLYGRDPSVALSRSGMVERANGGTLVLDSIEQVPARTSARLISLIDSRSFLALGAERPRPIDVRIIATTTGEKSATEATRSNVRGLLNRLSGITVALPPLNERREDIPEFFRLFVSEYEQSLGRRASAVSEAEWHHLITHDWPGNLRELQMFAQNFVLGLTQLTTVAPAAVDSETGLRAMMANFERTVLEDALNRAGGDIGEVRRVLSVPRKTLYDRLARHNLRPADFRK